MISLPKNTIPIVGRVLMTLGALLMLFVGFQLWGTGLQESQAQNSLEKQFEETLDSFKVLKESTEPDENSEEFDEDAALASLVKENAHTSGDAIGIIEMPSIGITKTIVEGITRDALRGAPGHYPNTAFPGQAGNAAVAGHRTTYGSPFADLDLMKPGDTIKVTTLQGEFYYEVESHEQDGKTTGYKIVDDTALHVLNDNGYDQLTLTACHPKYSAEQRIIVTAKLTTPPAPTIKLVDQVKTVDADGNELSSQDALAESLGWSMDELPLAILWGMVTLSAFAVAWFLSIAWRKWPAWLMSSPGIAIALFFFFTHLERLIPAY